MMKLATVGLPKYDASVHLGASLEAYIIGIKLPGVKVEFRTGPLPYDANAVDLALQLRSNLGYDAQLYHRQENGKLSKIKFSDLEKELARREQKAAKK